VPTLVPLLLAGILLRSPPPLQIELVFVGTPMRARVEAFALDEVTAIWAPHHVTFRISPADALPEDGRLRLAVILAERQDRHLAQGALGAVRFRAGTPEPTILLYTSAIATLVDETPQMHRGAECPPAVRDQMAGRVTGRALAHEIGHVLLRSHDHSADGLMRATHRSPDLVAAERHPFDLSIDDGRHVDEIVASLREHLTRGSTATVESC
jgi:hypothetical protein